MALSGREILSLLWLPGYTTRPETIIRQQGLLHPNWRRRPDSNRGMGVLQTPALPLGYAALVSMERETGLEPATFSLARRRSTTELLPQPSSL